MPIVYKIDVLSALKEAGYNTTRIRKEKIMGEAMLQKIRSGQMPSWGTLEQFHFLNENRAFSAVNTALFARPNVYRKTNGFLNATAGYISGEIFFSFLLGNKRGRHSREMALSYRKTVFASACGRSTFPAHRRKRKKAVFKSHI